MVYSCDCPACCPDLSPDAKQRRILWLSCCYVKAMSLFSGVGGFELGFERAGIETVLQAEQDPWCLKVLRRHYPTTVRINDVHKVSLARAHNAARRWSARRGHDWNHEQDEPESAEANRADAQREWSGVRGEDGTDGGEWDRGVGGDGAHARWDGRGSCIDLVYGGFPCQDLSVAGKRAGLGGERSGLWFEFHRVLRELRPRWAVIENVPGLLSSEQGRDFAVILDGLEELGFDVAWAVLDAQHFGVPQRRRRVFIVAGPSRRACEQVLSLCESCGGNPAAGGTPGQSAPEGTRDGSTCPISNCGRRVEKRGWCNTHYQRWRTHGDVNESQPVGFKGAEEATRFWAKVDKSGDCWLWSGALNDRGYGIFAVGTPPKDAIRAHRWAFENTVGVIPDGLQLDHLCRVRHCVRPDHLEPVTTQENTRRGIESRSIANPLGAHHHRQDLDNETYVLASAVSASAGHHGHSSPRGDGPDNLVVAGTLQAEMYHHGSYPNQTMNSDNAHVLPTPAGVRRLTPLECERLMGWPERQENITIEVCGEPLKSHAPAGARSPKLHGRAGSAASSGPPERASSAEPSSIASSQTTGRPAEVHAVWSCEDGTIALTTRPGESPLLVSSAEVRSQFARLGLNVDSAHLAAAMISTLARTILGGRAALPTNVEPSSVRWNGEPCVRLSGGEIEERASGAASTISAAIEAMKRTTSAVGPSSPLFASMLETLSYCAVAVICGLTPERTPSTSSFALRLSLSSGHTRFTADGTEIADGNRYRMAGNGVVAPVAEWLGRRLVEVDSWGR